MAEVDDAKPTPGDPVVIPHHLRITGPTTTEPIMGLSGEIVGERTVSASAQAPPLIEALWHSTPIGSTLASEWLQERLFPSDETPISTDELIERLTSDELWGFEDHFLHVQTVGQYNAIKNDIEREREDRRILGEYSMAVTLPVGLAVGMMDPTSWVPLKRAFDFARAGGVIRSTAGGAAIMGTYGVASEAVLQGTQQLRTWQESVQSVGASAVVGGVIGVAPHAFRMTRAAARRVVQDFRNFMYHPSWNEAAFNHATEAWNMINEEIATNPLGRKRRDPVTGVVRRQPSVAQLRERQQAFDALEAAFDRLEAWNSLSLFGWRAPWDSPWGPGRRGPAETIRTVPQRMLARLFGPGWQDPMDFIMRRAATIEGKKALMSISEVTQLLNQNVRVGRGSGSALPGQQVPIAQSAQSEAAEFMGGWATFYNEMWGGGLTETGQRVLGRGKTLYVQARRAGFQGSMEDFDRAVFRAVVNGHVDPNGNPAVTRAAERYRDLISNPIRDLANNLGYNIPDTPRYALGHAPRQWILGTVRGPDGQGHAFLRMVTRAYYNDLVLQWLQANPGLRPTPAQLGQMTRRARRMAREAFNNITGTNRTDGGFRLLDRDVIPGSMFMERVIPIADDYLVENGWIDGRITDVSNYQVRSVVPQLLLGSKFRTAQGHPDPSMEHSVIPRIKQEYNRLAHPEPAGAPAGTQPAAVNADEVVALQKEGQDVIQTLRNVRDGWVYGPHMTGQTSNWRQAERFLFMLRSYQAMRLMGNLVINSLADVSNLVLRNGLGPSLQTIVNNMTRAGIFKGTKFAGISSEVLRQEAVRWGAAIEWSSMSAMASRTDQLSPFQLGNITTAERWLMNLSRAYSISNLSLTWNDMVRMAAFRAGMDRILNVAAKGWDYVTDAERTSMVQIGLGRNDISRIGAAWRSQNQPLHDGFLWFAHMSSWQDETARRLMVAALEKDNASTVVRSKSGDFNTVAKNNPVMNAILQFQNFIFSHAVRVTSLAEQRLIADGFYGRDSLRVYTGLLVAAAMGMLSTYLYTAARDWSSAAEPGRRSGTEELLENPGQWISLGIERSALTGLFGQFNMHFERLGVPGQQAALQAILEDPSRTMINPARQRALEWGFNRTLIGILGGPSVSQAVDLTESGIRAYNHYMFGKPFRKSDARVMSQFFPFQNHVIARKFIFEPTRQYLSQDVMGLYE